MRKHKANHRWQRVNRGRRAEPNGGSGIKRWDPALGARQSPVYRLEIKVASSPVLHVPLPRPPFPSSSSSTLPPGESQVLASDGQEMSRPGWTADDDTVLLFSHLEKSFTAVCVSFHPIFCFLSQEMKIPYRAAMAPHGCFVWEVPMLEVI